MADREKVIKGLECCKSIDTDCDECPFKTNYEPLDAGDTCTAYLFDSAIECLKEQEAVIEQYHKADGFLAIHGWKWEGR